MSSNDLNIRASIDARRVRQLFERVSSWPVQEDFIAREVAARMAERLEYIKISPLRALDAGSGKGDDLARLRKRFPLAQWHALDFALPRLQESRKMEGASPGFFERLGRDLNLGRINKKTASPQWICADFAHLPLAPRSFELIWSNLALHWHACPHEIFPEWARVLNVGGLVLFSAFGPDTLQEVSDAFATIQDKSNSPSILPFTDMHDYGDMLVAAGFTTPVMDMERITLTYSDLSSLWRDVRALGGNALAQRRRGLLGRRAYQRLIEALDSQRDADGRYRLSFEIIYGHAWKGQPRTTADGQTIIRLDRPGKSTGLLPSKSRPA